MKRVVFILFLFFSGIHILLGQISPGPLSELHKQLEGISNCTQCHSIGNRVPNEKCLDCHKEIQSLIHKNRGYHVSSRVKSKSCFECHNEHHGRRFDLIRFDDTNFDHTLTGYKLQGKHKTLKCRDCHKPKNIANSRIRKVKETYLGMGQACLSCHDDYHQGTLDKTCTKCHNLNAWDPALKFNHNNTKFKLKGAHQKVDCLKCHKKTKKNNQDYQEFSGISHSNCTSCHKDQHQGSFGKNCKECHNENSWVNLNSGIQFDHSKADFQLIGMHRRVDCRKCHTSGHYTTPIDFSHCKNCHKDYHKGQFTEENAKKDCNDCHTVKSPFTFTLFGLEEHQKNSFKLEGSHLATPCFACHVKEKKWEFKDIGNACIDCHKDIHKGKIDEKYYPNQDCTQCHNPETWTQVNFDHSKTSWELEGPHHEASCKSCHFKANKENDTIIQQFNSLDSDCITCHTNKHGDQFAENGKTDCTKCHSVNQKWKPDKFNHSETLFPLTGKHKDLQCKSCHKAEVQEDNNKGIDYKIKKFKCIDCHSS